MEQHFVTAGKEISKIPVRISYRIIELFSEGLYKSPHKAIEELVSNSFDAGANVVTIKIPPDLGDKQATIWVVDDGIGMDQQGLRQHWLIGVTNKREGTFELPKGRKQIGKFGIGKLATYVLANRLTHISKVNSKYYATSMNFKSVPAGVDRGIHAEKQVQLPLRSLTEAEARRALSAYLASSKPGYQASKLFGERAWPTWTVAILSDLKQMATNIKMGILQWVLSTALPLRDDFRVFLNGDEVLSSKLRGKKVGKWILGKHITESSMPPLAHLEVSVDESEEKTSLHRYGLRDSELGRVTGYAELYEDLLTTGKSTEIERSHGFFVCVRGRLINIDDEYFGIDRNLLRHGTFSRFRMVVNIDRLDEELRSSRETVREGVLFNRARSILKAVFNFARGKLEAHESHLTAAQKVGVRVASSPVSLTARPLITVISAALRGDISPRYISYPAIVDEAKRESFIRAMEERAGSTEGLVRGVEKVDMGLDQGIALYDAATGFLNINSLHPFVAHFLDEYEDKKRSLPLELLAMSEVLMEAHLYQQRLSESQVHDIINERDELLRFLARSTGKRNAFMIAQDLLDSSNDSDALEVELVAAFDSMGFDAIPKGGRNKPDGIAEAFLSSVDGKTTRRYKVSLEAKSSVKEGKTISAKDVGVSTIARQRDESGCDHAIVAGPNFPTTRGEPSALVREISADRDKSGKTITLITLIDLARLVRLVPAKRIGLVRFRELFETCTTPEETKAWVDKLAREESRKEPYKEILETIWGQQFDVPDHVVEYGSLMTALRMSKNIRKSRDDLKDLCRALSRMAPEYVFAREESVELTQRPDKILDAIRATIERYPEEERDQIYPPKE